VRAGEGLGERASVVRTEGLDRVGNLDCLEFRGLGSRFRVSGSGFEVEGVRVGLRSAARDGES